MKRENIKLAGVLWGIDLDLLKLCPQGGVVIVYWVRKGYRVFFTTLEVFAQIITRNHVTIAFSGNVNVLRIFLLKS